ncbi:MAG: hypothetical protein IV090_03360 [Candidatus Sericytochromatia bacterium]|nr:hypothetical protein [Candidatus Sericytochromatia bacterium]
MNLFSVLAQRDTLFHQVDWNRLEHQDFNLSSYQIHSEKFYIFNGLFVGHPSHEKHILVFYPQAFQILSDLLISNKNSIFYAKDVKNNEFKDERKNAPLFCVLPTHVDCGEPYPTYASIAQHRPADLHFFKKFADADFYLVTQTFVDRVKATGVRGLSFVLRWDGERSYPLLPKT